MGGRGGGSGLGSARKTSRESSTLPDLPENTGGRIRIFHDTMNAPSARGDNDVRYTGDMHETPASPYGYSAPGTYEVLKNGGALDRVSGEITAFNGRLFGIQHTETDGYLVTDLRTGRLISRESSIYKAYDAMRAFDDWLSRESVRKSTESAEAAFRDVHKKR